MLSVSCMVLGWEILKFIELNYETSFFSIFLLYFFLMWSYFTSCFIMFSDLLWYPLESIINNGSVIIDGLQSSLEIL